MVAALSVQVARAAAVARQLGGSHCHLLLTATRDPCSSYIVGASYVPQEKLAPKSHKRPLLLLVGASYVPQEKRAPKCQRRTLTPAPNRTKTALTVLLQIVILYNTLRLHSTYNLHILESRSPFNETQASGESSPMA